MYRTYQFPLYPNKIQNIELNKILLLLGNLYNAALQEQKEYYRKHKEQLHIDESLRDSTFENSFFSFFNQCKNLTILRNEPIFAKEYGAISAVICRSALDRAAKAYLNFFVRLKKNLKAGLPRFKKSAKYDSFWFEIKKNTIKNNKINIPNFGYVKFRQTREFPAGTILKRATIKRRNDCWYVCFQLEIPDLAQISLENISEKKFIGIDMGLVTLATLSNGDIVANHRFAKQAEDEITRLQRILSRKKKGSNSRKRAKKLLARAYEHVRNQRLDQARKEAKKIVEQFDVICIEDLKIQQMISQAASAGSSNNAPKPKSFGDAAIRIFLQCLICKAQEAGKYIIEIDSRNTSQRCSGCNKIAPKQLHERTHHCPHCGLKLNRDHNAAINVLHDGLKSCARAPGMGASAAILEPVVSNAPTKASENMELCQ